MIQVWDLVKNYMRLIAIRKLRQDIIVYPDVRVPIEAWYATIKKVSWQNLEEVRQTYRDAEAVGNFTVFNISGKLSFKNS